MRFVGIFLFYESNPSGPLINWLKCFYLKICFHGDIHEISDPEQTNNAQGSQTLRRLTQLGVRLCAG